MDEKKLAREARERAAKRRLGTDNPRCATCGCTDWECLEAHHIAGQTYDPTTVIHCRNCHRILSDWQKDHPTQAFKPKSFEETLAHFLEGMADMFELLVRKLREFAMEISKKLQTHEDTKS